MISSRREDRTSGAAPAEAPARPLLRDQLRPHLRQTFPSGAARWRRRDRASANASPSRIRTTAAETNETAWHIIDGVHRAARARRRLRAPARGLFAALKAIRGHNMAKAAVEMAAWDLYARGSAASRCRRVARRLARIASRPASRSAFRIRSPSWSRRSRASSTPAISASRSRSSRAGIVDAVDSGARAFRPTFR